MGSKTHSKRARPTPIEASTLSTFNLFRNILKLPPELRNEIYLLALTNDELEDLDTSDAPFWTHVNKQVHVETLELWLSTQPFAFQVRCDFPIWRSKRAGIPSGKSKKILNFEIVAESERQIQFRDLNPTFTHIEMQLESSFPAGPFKTMTKSGRTNSQEMAIELWLGGKDEKPGVLLITPDHHGPGIMINTATNVDKIVHNLTHMVEYIAKSAAIVGFTIEDIKMWSEKDPKVALPSGLVVNTKVVTMAGGQEDATVNVQDETSAASDMEDVEMEEEDDSDLVSSDWDSDDDDDDWLAENGA